MYDMTPAWLLYCHWINDCLGIEAEQLKGPWLSSSQRHPAPTFEARA